MYFRLFVLLAALAFAHPAAAQDCTNPDAALGVIKYNFDYDVYQGCTKRGWEPFHARAQVDITSDAFSFTDQTDVALSALTESNIVQITGIDAAVAVSISGDGSPAYRICTDGSSDANCDGSAVQDWTSGAANITNNQYLQLRLTSNASESTMNSATVTVGTESDQWDVTTTSSCPSSGLVGHWMLNESGNVSTAADSSGNGNDGTLTNFPANPSASWVTGKLGNALDFEGNNSEKITISDAAILDPSAAVTFSAWVKPESLPTAGVIDKELGSANGYRLRLDGTADRLQCDVWTSNGTERARSPTVTAGNWYHYVCTYDGANVRAYTNGSLTETLPLTGTIDASAEDLYIGARGTDQYFDGLIDDVRIYNRALDATEIDELYNGGAGCQ